MIAGHSPHSVTLTTLVAALSDEEYANHFRFSIYDHQPELVVLSSSSSPTSSSSFLKNSRFLTHIISFPITFNPTLHSLALFVCSRPSSTSSSNHLLHHSCPRPVRPTKILATFSELAPEVQLSSLVSHALFGRQFAKLCVTSLLRPLIRVHLHFTHFRFSSSLFRSALDLLSRSLPERVQMTFAGRRCPLSSEQLLTVQSGQSAFAALFTRRIELFALLS
jgi:hypothetical protein